MVKTRRIIFEEKIYTKDTKNLNVQNHDGEKIDGIESIENPRHSDFIYGKEAFGINQLLGDEFN